jgi:hypothetical protein
MSPPVRPQGDGDAAAELRCPDCGARNSATAQWCGQCARSFVAAPQAQAGPAPVEPDLRAARGDSAAGVARDPAPAARGPFRVVGEVVAWTCAVCDSTNPLDRSDCQVCSAPLAATLHPPPEPPRRDPGLAALLSLILPGGGHAYVGIWGQAVARAVTSAWVVFVALLSAVQRGLLAPLPLLFEGAAVALWLVAAHDAYREAAGQGGAVILRGRLLTWVLAGLVLLSVAATLAAAMAAL